MASSAGSVVMVVVVVVVAVVVRVRVLLHRVPDTLKAVLAALDPLVHRGRPAARSPRELERVRQDAQERLEVLLGGLGAAGEGHDEGTGAVACGRVDDAGDGARERGKWGDGEGRGEHGDDEPGGGAVNEGGNGLRWYMV